MERDIYNTTHSIEQSSNLSVDKQDESIDSNSTNIDFDDSTVDADSTAQKSEDENIDSLIADDDIPTADDEISTADNDILIADDDILNLVADEDSNLDIQYSIYEVDRLISKFRRDWCFDSKNTGINELDTANLHLRLGKITADKHSIESTQMINDINNLIFHTITNVRSYISYINYNGEIKMENRSELILLATFRSRILILENMLIALINELKNRKYATLVQFIQRIKYRTNNMASQIQSIMNEKQKESGGNYLGEVLPFSPTGHKRFNSLTRILRVVHIMNSLKKVVDKKLKTMNESLSEIKKSMTSIEDTISALNRISERIPMKIGASAILDRFRAEYKSWYAGSSFTTVMDDLKKYLDILNKEYKSLESSSIIPDKVV